MLTILCLISRAMSSGSATKIFRGPRPLVICGPSGSGKSTLLKRLFKEFPYTFGFSISHTTRQPRKGEVDGVDYHFVTRENMLQYIANDEFIEHAEFAGNIYGTSKQSVAHVQAKGLVCILDIEPQGVEQIRKTNLNPILIFNNPPTMAALEERIRKRGTETDETLRKRLESATREIQYGLIEGNFHKVILNDDMERAYQEFRDFIVEQLKLQEKDGIIIRWN